MYVDRFPWKFLIHILLVIGCTAQVLFLNVSEGKHFRSHELVFYNQFFKEDLYTDIGFERFQNIFTLDELVQLVNTSVTNYF